MKVIFISHDSSISDGLAAKWYTVWARSEEQNKDKEDKRGGGSGVGTPNHEKLILDTSCAQADIRYPIDFSLLNEGRGCTHFP